MCFKLKTHFSLSTILWDLEMMLIHPFWMNQEIDTLNRPHPYLLRISSINNSSKGRTSLYSLKEGKHYQHREIVTKEERWGLLEMRQIKSKIKRAMFGNKRASKIWIKKDIRTLRFSIRCNSRTSSWLKWWRKKMLIRFNYLNMVLSKRIASTFIKAIKATVLLKQIMICSSNFYACIRNPCLIVVAAAILRAHVMMPSQWMRRLQIFHHLTICSISCPAPRNPTYIWTLRT